MRVIKKENIGKREVYDLTVEKTNSYVTGNGIVNHNTGVMYSANQVFVMGKSQIKDGNEIVGYDFSINIEKSRFVKEKSKLPFTVLNNQGIQKWSSMFELAVDAGFIKKPKVGWYTVVDPETGEVDEKSRRKADIEQDNAFFEKLMNSQEFKDYVSNKYKLNASDVNSLPSDIVDEDDETE